MSTRGRWRRSPQSSSDSGRERPRVLMLGPALAQRGGIAAVERTYFDAWDHERYEVRHVATYASHYDRPLVKLGIACRAFLVALWYLITWRPTILHVHFSWKGSFYRKSPFILAGRALRVPHILLHSHAASFHLFYDPGGPLRRWWIRFVIGQADRLVVLGEWWRRYFTDLGIGVPIEVLPNPVVGPASTRSCHERRCAVLTLGELGARKGTYDTLRAIPGIVRRHPDVEFWLAGDGEVARVKGLTDDGPWVARVKLLGWVEGSAKAGLLDQAGVFLLPSYNEGLPVALLEAMAHGVPVVATRVGAIPDAVTDGETGYLIEPGDVDALVDRVSRLLADPDHAARLASRARNQTLATYGVQTIMPRLYGIYDGLSDVGSSVPHDVPTVLV